MNRVVELKSENSLLLRKIKHDDHDVMIKAFSKLQVAHVNLQLKQQHLKENVNNLKSKSPRDVPEFDVFSELGMRDDQIQSHKNTIRKLKAQISELKANKKTLREIVEHAKVERPLNTSLASACRYTKRSQELLKGALAASESKPRSNTMKDRTLPARSALKQVEAHSRMNKSNEKQKNHVDSSISFKRTKPTGRIFPLGDQCPLTRITKPKALPVKQWKTTGRLIPLDGQCPLVRPPAPTNSPNPVASNLVVQIVLWYLDSGCSKHMTGDRLRLRNFMKKFIGTVRFRNDHFGAIMAYGDYVIGDRVISRLYYVEGLGHNIFSVS
ncbi:hypothetical protein Tco_1329646 [Tanacetum coccineum]